MDAFYIFFFFPDCYGLNFQYYLNRIGVSKHPCLVLALRSKDFCFSLLSMRLATGFSFLAFFMLSYLPSVLNLFNTFIMKRHLILSNAFSAATEMTIRFLSFILFMQCIMYIDLLILKLCLHSMDKSHLILMCDPFDMLFCLVF